jgi:hypothetical protein
MRKIQVWIYKNEAGDIYQIRVVHRDNSVQTVPVSNTEEKKLRRLCQGMYGRCQFTTVQILPENGL